MTVLGRRQFHVPVQNITVQQFSSMPVGIVTLFLALYFILIPMKTICSIHI